MKNKLLLLLLLLYSISSFSQTRNYVQELYDMLGQNRFFEAREFYEENKEHLTDGLTFLYYNSKKHEYQNRPDSANMYIESIKYYYSEQLGASIATFYEPQMNNSIALGDYESAISAVRDYISFVEDNPTIGSDSIRKLAVENRKNSIKLFEKLAQFPKRSAFLPEVDTQLKIKTEPLLISEDVIYNGVKLRTVFDTGSSPAFGISKTMADSIGIREINGEPLYNFNGVDMRANYGIIDSIKMGSVLLVNYPVAIFYDGFMPHNVSDSILEVSGKRKKIEDGLNSFDIIMGTPVLSLFTSFEIDFENEEITFSSRDTERDLSEKSNMFIFGGGTYIQTLMNAIPFTAFLDLGDTTGGIAIKNPFYENNKSAFPIVKGSEESEIEFLVSGHHKFSKLKSSRLNVTIFDKTIDATDTTMIVNKESRKHDDGTIGLLFLKKFKKVSFDFQNMVFKTE